MFGRNKDALVEAGLIYPDPKPVTVFITFTGATIDYEDGVLVDIVPREKIVINVNRIDAFYDHTILIDGRKIRVMETLAEIREKIGGVGE